MSLSLILSTLNNKLIQHNTKVNTQINKHFDLNEYFIAKGINIQCPHTIVSIDVP